MNFQMDGFKEERIIRNQYEFMKSYWDNFTLISSMVMRLRNQEKAVHWGLLMSISSFLLFLGQDKDKWQYPGATMGLTDHKQWGMSFAQGLGRNTASLRRCRGDLCQNCK